MNRIIQGWDAVRDGDLMLCRGNGVAYQADMQQLRVRYDDAYLRKCESYQGNAIATAANAGRIAMLQRHLPAGSSILDVGAGSGEFLRAARVAGFDPRGFDVIPSAAHALILAELWDDDPQGYDAVTMWDSIEHMEDPATWLARVRQGAALFVSLPIFTGLDFIRQSKHYRPGEHLYYWTADGFVRWLGQYRFRLVEASNHEIQAGRESIGAFAFRRDTN